MAEDADTLHMKLASNIEIPTLLQSHCLMDAVVAYMKAEVIPKRPAACFRYGTTLYPELGFQGAGCSFDFQSY